MVEFYLIRGQNVGLLTSFSFTNGSLQLQILLLKESLLLSIHCGLNAVISTWWSSDRVQAYKTAVLTWSTSAVENAHIALGQLFVILRAIWTVPTQERVVLRRLKNSEILIQLGSTLYLLGSCRHHSGGSVRIAILSSTTLVGCRACIIMSGLRVMQV